MDLKRKVIEKLSYYIEREVAHGNPEQIVSALGAVDLTELARAAKKYGDLEYLLERAAGRWLKAMSESGSHPEIAQQVRNALGSTLPVAM